MQGLGLVYLVTLQFFYDRFTHFSTQIWLNFLPLCQPDPSAQESKFPETVVHLCPPE